MYSFQKFWKPCGRWTKKEGLGGRKINWVIEIIWRRIIQISTIVAVHSSTCVPWRERYTAIGRRERYTAIGREGFLYRGLPVTQENEEFEIIVKFPVYVTGKKVMLFLPRRSKRKEM